jgi:ubiquinone/menaquinone biosynthesis C-methylase UbiE
MLFTDLVGLEADFYRGRSVLDIGCGPRGSLEWAEDATRRVGLDPLADDYRELGTDEHAMEYVAAGSEAMPFADEVFDIVTSINSLDHVDDLEATAAEIKRVTRPDGHLLLAVEVGHDPTWTEPQSFGWDICDVFAPEFEVVSRGEYERDEGWMFDAALRRERFDHTDTTPRSGILSAVLHKRAAI